MFDMIDEDTAHKYTCFVLIFLAPIVFYVLMGGQKAEYGRYSKPKSGIMKPIIPGRMDWFLHSTSLLSVFNALQKTSSDEWKNHANLYILGMFVLHYIWRSIGFAFMVQSPKPMSIPLAISTSGFCFLNGWLQSRSAIYYDAIEVGPRFYFGAFLFFSGWAINFSSDLILINLRSGPEDKGYYIPKGFMFEYVSGANFFGECVEWFGFAIASNFMLAPLTFSVFTFSNLAPRAYQHHTWYLNKFKEEYPKNRKALIPFLF